MNKASYPYRFPKQFKQLRKALALSQTALADKLGLDQTLLSKWELGERTPSLESAMKICRLAGVSLDWLIFARGNAILETKKPETGKE
ncbi:MAG: helix-turn-helix transcriptional regulator [Calditrichia bacterium]